MTPTLHPPQREEASETTASEASFEPFPYRPVTDGEGLLLPAPNATLALRSTGEGPDGDPGSFACPACGDETLNGAGLFACPTCDWTGRLD